MIEPEEEVKGSRICHPIICHCGILIMLSYRHLKNSKCRERIFLNSYLPKDRFSKRNSVAVNPLPRSFTNHGRLTVVTGETRCRHHTQANCHKLSYLPSILRVHSSFLKIIYSPLRGLHTPHLPFSIRWYLSLSSKPPLWVSHFPLVISHVYVRYTC